MESLLQDIERALDAEMYFVALQSTLTLPDICAALESDTGKTTRAKYIAWYKKYVYPNIDFVISAEECYDFRCSYVHQGSAKSERKDKGNNVTSKTRVCFVYPDPSWVIHNCVGETGNDKVIALDLKEFCLGIIACVRNWMNTVKDNANFKRNYPNLITICKDGFAPYIVCGRYFIG